MSSLFRLGRPSGSDFVASLVVFLVALPLCMGIAIASGVPAALGLVTGIVGGLVVGMIAGSPLQVSGPAAGLAVLVWEIVQREGLAALGIIVLIAGGIQLVAGLLRFGRLFQAVAPSVIHGMLAGIGVIILFSQLLVMFDDKPRGSVLANVSALPAVAAEIIRPNDGSVHHVAAMVGFISLVALVGWNVVRPKKLSSVPAALVAVVIGTVVAEAFGLPISRVVVPESLLGALNVPSLDVLSRIVEPGIWATAGALALIASAETLLCASAVDQMHDGERTDYDRELVAQGVGNLICGAAGALPMTGVIVRSSANVAAGAKTRWSAIMHGGWLLVLVVAAPFVLERIPVASLAAVLVYTGYKLVNLAVLPKLAAFGKVELGVYGATVAFIVFGDLLTGVAVGVVLALARLLYAVAKLRVIVDSDDDSVTIRMLGVGSFLAVPTLAGELAKVPPGRVVTVDRDGLTYLDQACVEQLEGWKRIYEANGGRVDLGVAPMQPKASATPVAAK